MIALLLTGTLFLSSAESFESCDIVAPEYCSVIWWN